MVFFQCIVKQDAAHDGFCLIIFYHVVFLHEEGSKLFRKETETSSGKDIFGCNVLLDASFDSTSFDHNLACVCVPRISFNTLLDASLDAKPSDPDAVLDLMDKKGVKPDTTTFNTLIKRCVCTRTCKKAIRHPNW